MAIEVKSGGNPGATLLASYAGGQGEARNRFAMAQAQTQARSNDNERDRRFTLTRDKANRDSRIAESESERAFIDKRDAASRDFAINRDAEGRDFTLARDEAQEELRAHFGREEFDYRLTAEQRAQFNQLTRDYATAAESGDFSADELKEMRRQTYAKQMGMSSMPVIKEPSPFPEGQRAGQTWASEDGRFIFSRDDKGNVKKIADIPEDSIDGKVEKIGFKEYSAMYSAAAKDLMNASAEGTPPSPKAIKAEVTQRIKAWQELISGKVDTPKPEPGSEWEIKDDDSGDTEANDAPAKKEKSAGSRWKIN